MPYFTQIKITTLDIISAIVAILNLEMQQMDIISIFF